MIRRAFVFAVMFVAAANTSLAQPKLPIGRFVADLQVTSSGLPTAEGWTPAVPQGTEVPSRGIGLQGGAHVFLSQFRWGRLGLGAAWMIGRGSTSAPGPEKPVAGQPPPPPAPAVIPDVATRISSVTPQVSLNFGHSLGWSYLSAGYGLTSVTSTRTAVPAGAVAAAAPAATLESGKMGAINFGGGARWFINDRIGVGFDLRWHRLPPVSDRGFSGRASLLTAAVGLSIKDQ